jgi:hypothetical protein
MAGYSWLITCQVTGPTAATPAAIAASFKNGPCELPKTPKFKGSVGPQYVIDLPNTEPPYGRSDLAHVVSSGIVGPSAAEVVLRREEFLDRVYRAGHVSRISFSPSHATKP